MKFLLHQCLHLSSTCRRVAMWTSRTEAVAYTEPSKCHANFVLDFSSLDFFLDFFPDLFLDYFPTFFHRLSDTSKAHSWVEVLRDMAWFDS